MKVLVVGSGGREHALCWRLAQSPSVDKVFCAPGNPGTSQCATNVPVAAEDLDGLAALARRESIELTVVGPEVSLCAGIRDRFEQDHLLVAGPSAAAARLEGSKAFAKQSMQRWSIPTAPFAVVEDLPAAERFLQSQPAALVVKADGLAAGKGVVVCDTPQDALAAAKRMLEGELGQAGRRVVLEEKLSGEEASFMVLTDGQRICPLATSQDHKAAWDGDKGPNTGGMGAYSPAPVVDRALTEQVLERIIRPTISGLAQDGTPYQGILYVGLMVQEGIARVLEYNCRLGDPETQPLMARLRSDWVPYLVGAAQGKLPEEPLQWDPRLALCVVLAAAGYPGTYEKGAAIRGVEWAEEDEAVTVFHAGTAEKEGRLTTAGGRVLGVTALGPDVAAARKTAYEAVQKIQWPGMHYRSDIGHRAL